MTKKQKQRNRLIIQKPSDETSHWPTNGWSKAVPESQGIDSNALADVVAASEQQELHSLVVIRKGSLVAEAYREPLHPDSLQDMKSVTKSITSALVGIALSENKLQSLNQTLASFLPELAGDMLKSKITVKHLLTMTSGIHWVNHMDQSSVEMMFSPNWVEYILNRPMAHDPGTKFNYSNGDAHLLSAILERATGQTLAEFAKTRLFEPLGITNFTWNQDPQGHTIGAWALTLTAQDMAKLGLLYLKKGQWGSKAILPRQWVKESLTTRVRQTLADGSQGGYGFYWYLKQIGVDKQRVYDVFYAAGSAGKRIFVVPALQLIAALSADSQDAHMPELTLRRILQAVRTNGSLPRNQQATDRLEEAIQSFAGMRTFVR
jgi:CubicO group peptidase (beta-lactamase class C family)